MSDYKDEIMEVAEEKIFEFEEREGREPTEAERLEMYEEAREYVIERACAWADYQRKVAKGE